MRSWRPFVKVRSEKIPPSVRNLQNFKFREVLLLNSEIFRENFKIEKMGLARQALDAYLLKLNTYPLRMQLMTGTMIGYAGDAIAQLGF